VMQAEAAAMVAGSDRLVLVVGPAGAGKTTMLQAGVTDLARHGHEVFGLAPTAKAARVLETETGMALRHGRQTALRMAPPRPGDGAIADIGAEIHLIPVDFIN
jgi:ATP-dependent exoDNAse (exonuclease V) alpha subunit